jgi:hypothetical protein
LAEASAGEDVAGGYTHERRRSRFEDELAEAKSTGTK